MKYQVVIAATCGRISGVDVFSAILARGLVARGIPAHVLLTAPSESVVDSLAFPPDVPVETLSVESGARWPARWRAMVRYLEDRAPCVYLPNYDFQYSCVSPKLSSGVAVVGCVHSDDPDHYDHVERMGRYWDATVAVSPTIAERVVAASGGASRVTVVQYGIEIPSNWRERSEDAGPLRVVYAGRLVQHQKRVLDLPRIVEAALARGVRVELTVVGDGPDGEALRAASESLIARGAVRFLGALPNDAVLRQLGEHDAFVLPSEFEGLPVALLEAMASGCVPVVSDIRSGIPDVVEDGVNGYRVPVGDADAFAERLARLASDRDARLAMARLARETVRLQGYDADTMVDRYVEIFERALSDAASGAFARPAGAIDPPGWMKPLWKHYLPQRVRDLAGGPLRLGGRVRAGLRDLGR